MARGGYIGIKECGKYVWPSTGQRAGIFPNFGKTTEPTRRSDGSSLAAGDLWYDTTNNLGYFYTGAAWTLITTVAGTYSLEAAYNGGNTINRDIDPIAISDALAGVTNTFTITKSNTGSGNLIGITHSAAATGDAINISMTNTAVDAQALVITGQAAARTGVGLVYITENGTGAVPTLSITATDATTGPLFKLSTSAAIAPVANTNGIMTLDMSNAAVATQGLLIIGPAAGRTGAAIRVSDAGTSSGGALSIACSGTNSANVIGITYSGAATGDAVNLTMTNTNAAAQALVITGQATTRTGVGLVYIRENGDGAVPCVSIYGHGVTTGALLKISGDGAVAPVADTDGMITLDVTNAADATQGLLIYANTATRSGAALRIYDAATTSTGPLISLYTNAAHTGNLLAIATGAAIAGDALNITMTNAAVGAQALVITGQAAARTGVGLVHIVESGTGAVPTASILGHAVTTGALLKVYVDAAAAPVADTDGLVTIATTASANAAQGLLLYNNTAAHTGPLIRCYDAAASAASLLSLYTAGINTGNILGISTGGAITGDAINITMTNAGVGAQALVIEGQAAIRTGAGLVTVTENGTGAVPLIAVLGHAATTGALLKVYADAAAAPVNNTDGLVTIATTSSANATQGLLLYNNTAAHTGTMLRILDNAATGSMSLLALATNAANTGNLLAISTAAAITGDAVNITMTNAAAGAQAIVITGQATGRNDANGLVYVSELGTGAVPTVGISGDAVTTGPLLKLSASAAVAPVANTNGMMTINTTSSANATQGLLVYNNTAVHTGSLIALYDNAGTGALSLLSLYTTTTNAGNIIAYSSGGAITGDVININMANCGNGAQALTIAGTATGTAALIAVSACGVGANGVGVALDIINANNLAAGADTVRIYCSGSPSSTSSVVEIKQDTGAGTAGAYALTVNASGTNVEAISVPAGNVVLVEKLRGDKKYHNRQTANYTITAADSGAILTNGGAAGAIAFTLPTAAVAFEGVYFWVFVVTGQTVTVTCNSAGDLVILNDASANSMAWVTGGQLIGGWAMFACVEIAGAATYKWVNAASTAIAGGACAITTAT